MRLFGPLALAALAVLPAPGRASETLDFEPCHLQDLSTWALCGSLEVPEDHLQPSGPSLRLRVAVLPAVEQPAQPDPIFLLAGGPGQSAIGLAASVEGALGPANRTRDVVLVDQRGAGGSSPLVCDSLDFLALAFDPGAKRRAVSECLEGLEVDPTLFGTVDFIRDLELVRQALGAERVHLYGGSYGTRAAQVYLREFPQSVASATLDAVASMEMRVGLHMGRDAEPALRDLFRRCAARPRCAERFPDLEARFEALLEDLERSPRDLELPETRSGRPETLRMDHRVFALGIRGLLYSPATLRLVPLLIDQAERGEWAGFHGVSALLAGSIAETMNQTLLLAVLCTEDL
ncbi:MAG: alpha/beta fold hydrolase, partial [Acidobacteriota bacterium]